jgi:hypothetical protein
MNDALGMCCPERVCNLNCEFQHLVERKRLARNSVLQRCAVEKLHRNEMLTVLLAYVVNGADVRMIQCRSRLRFASEAFQGARIVEHFRRQEFQAHGAVEPCVLSFVDNTHTAATELFDDAIVRDGLANHGRSSGERHLRTPRPERQRKGQAETMTIISASRIRYRRHGGRGRSSRVRLSCRRANGLRPNRADAIFSACDTFRGKGHLSV